MRGWRGAAAVEAVRTAPHESPVPPHPRLATYDVMVTSSQ